MTAASNDSPCSRTRAAPGRGAGSGGLLTTRFLVDEDLPRSLVRCLLTAGFDALDVRDAGLRGRSDPEIAAQARADRRALVSADLGFANVLKYPTGSHPGIVIVRFPNEIPVAALCEAVVRALAGLSEEELGAALIILFERLDPRAPD